MRIAYKHLALFVSDLLAAEEFYAATFGMRVMFREVLAADGQWYTVPDGKGWDEIEATGAAMAMVALGAGDLVLPIFSGDPQPGTVLEIGLTVDSQEEIDAMSDRLPDDATLLNHEYGDFFFSDPFGYTWHVNREGQAFRSNGEHSGRWLDV